MEIPSLKKLTSQYIGKNYKNFEEKINNTATLPRECKKAIAWEKPLTDDNVLNIFKHNQDREQECLEFFYQHNSPPIYFKDNFIYTSSQEQEKHIREFFYTTLQNQQLEPDEISIAIPELVERTFHDESRKRKISCYQYIGNFYCLLTCVFMGYIIYTISEL